MLIYLTPSARLTHSRSPLDANKELKSFRNDHGENHHELEYSVVCRKCGCKVVATLSNVRRRRIGSFSQGGRRREISSHFTGVSESTKGDKFVDERMRKDNVPPSAKVQEIMIVAPAFEIYLALALQSPFRSCPICIHSSEENLWSWCRCIVSKALKEERSELCS